MMNRTADAFLFFRAWLSAPLRVASVTPSGRALSSLMTAEISAQTGTVIELGPGTGVFTEALLQRGVAEENLVLVEYGAEFANQLSNRKNCSDGCCSVAQVANSREGACGCCCQRPSSSIDAVAQGARDRGRGIFAPTP